MNIEVFRQSAIKLQGKIIIYFDPFKITNQYHDADYIFITHDHYDHYDEESIKNVLKDTTKIIVPQILKERIEQITSKYLVVEPNKDYQLDNLTFTNIPAYNINKKFHPKDLGYVGYNLKVDNVSYYIMGDTDVTEESKQVKADICFVPIGGTFTMDVFEAAAYINYLQPKKAIPIHYGSIIGSIALGQEFKKLIAKNIEVDLYIKEEEK